MKKNHIICSLLLICSVVFLIKDLYAADLELSGTLGSGDYISDANITTLDPCVVQSGNDVTFVANDNVTLNPGFHAESGSTFLAKAGYAYDSDNDSMADYWEVKYLGGTGAGKLDDPDSDGLTNIEEFVLGTMPNDDTSYYDKSWFIDAQTLDPLTSVTVPSGGEITVRLRAQIPNGKTLKAYHFTLTYDENLIQFPPSVSGQYFANSYNNTDTSGVIIINGFDTTGVTGPDAVSFIDITLHDSGTGSFNLGIIADSFGTSFSDQFAPLQTDIPVIVE